MSLAPGNRLGAYEIVALIGAGGMGELYRAKDTRLKRDVAVKVLPDAFVDDVERLARFQREAELLATLNHPNVGAVYGFEQAQSANAIVLELIEGETLAERIRRGPIEIKNALSIALQIAEALEAAHEHGVIHRDLKPANIKITPDDKVKVLDFGLAKAMETKPAAEMLSHSPTLSMMATQAGMILGTAAYMSPEQAKGLPADQRSDIFAFGAILYEMLTGRQPFQGDTAPDVLASVIVRDPDLNALPSGLNPRLRELLERCLAKNPKDRWQAIGDVRVEIDHALAAPTVSAVPSVIVATPPHAIWRRAIPLIACAIAFTVIGAAAAWRYRPQVDDRSVLRFTIPLPPNTSLANTVRQVINVSPDGSQIAFVAGNTLFVHSLSDFTSRRIAGIDASQGRFLNPVFSPDGRSIAFYSGTEEAMKRMAVSGGAAVSLCRVPSPLNGMSWGEEGIVYGQGPNGIDLVPATGGTPKTIARVEVGEHAYGPQILPGGRAVLFTIARGTAPDRWDKATIVIQDLASGQRKTLINGGSDGRFIPMTDDEGYVLYALGGSVFAVPFDLRRLEVMDGPTPVIEGVRRSQANSQGAVQLSLSSTGTLVYFRGPVSPVERVLGLLDRDGVAQPLKLPSGPYLVPRVSPDGTHIAFGTDDGKEAAIWIYDVSGQAAMRRLTFGGRNRFPIWSPDGRYIAYQSDQSGSLGIFRQRADGSGAAERLTKPDNGVAHMPDVWTPAGDKIFFTATTNNEFRVWALDLNSHKLEPFEDMRSQQLITPVVSPDGKWIAYTSTETGLNQIFVQPLPPTGAKYQLSKGGGHHAMWLPSGRELVYDRTAGVSELVSLTFTPTFAVGNPINWPRGPMLFAGGASPRPVDMAPDGRILAGMEASDDPAVMVQNAPPIHVVVNWLEELKQRVPLRAKDRKTN